LASCTLAVNGTGWSSLRPRRVAGARRRRRPGSMSGPIPNSSAARVTIEIVAESLSEVVVILLEIFEEAESGRLPSEQLPRHGGGGGAVQGDEVAKVAEAFDGVGRGH
jgi:hypothetical protein